VFPSASGAYSSSRAADLFRDDFEGGRPAHGVRRQPHLDDGTVAAVHHDNLGVIHVRNDEVPLRDV
jgi:hypothetical protein